MGLADASSTSIRPYAELTLLRGESIKHKTNETFHVAHSSSKA